MVSQKLLYIDGPEKWAEAFAAVVVDTAPLPEPEARKLIEGWFKAALDEGFAAGHEEGYRDGFVS